MTIVLAPAWAIVLSASTGCLGMAGGIVVAGLLQAARSPGDDCPRPCCQQGADSGDPKGINMPQPKRADNPMPFIEDTFSEGEPKAWRPGLTGPC